MYGSPLTGTTRYSCSRPVQVERTRLGVESSPISSSPVVTSCTFLMAPSYIMMGVSLPRHLPYPGRERKYATSGFGKGFCTGCECFVLVCFCSEIPSEANISPNRLHHGGGGGPAEFTEGKIPRNQHLIRMRAPYLEGRWANPDGILYCSYSEFFF